MFIVSVKILSRRLFFFNYMQAVRYRCLKGRLEGEPDHRATKTQTQKKRGIKDGENWRNAMAVFSFLVVCLLFFADANCCDLYSNTFRKSSPFFQYLLTGCCRALHLDLWTFFPSMVFSERLIESIFCYRLELSWVTESQCHCHCRYIYTIKYVHI